MSLRSEIAEILLGLFELSGYFFGLVLGGLGIFSVCFVVLFLLGFFLF